MPAPFRRITVDQFAELVRLFNFKRKITSFDVHHTWKPRRRDFAGLKSIEAMDRHHRIERGFSDIAQHISLDPQGFIWTGRSWNAPPASALGFNGNSKAGPFMMEMIGDFDKGKEPFDGVQAENAYRIVAIILRHFNLGTQAIRFHNEMSSKSCPGTSIDKTAFIKRVKEAMSAMPRDLEEEVDEGTRELQAEALTGLLEPLSRDAATRAADIDGELPEEEETYQDYVARTAAEADLDFDDARAARTPTAAQLAELVPHVVNLRRGELAEDGLFVSNEGTVDAIFAGLETQLKDAAVPKPLKLVFVAHGGLVSQRGALEKAHRDLWWWKANGIYPIFFVWHTDLGTALRDVLLRSRAGRRDLADLSDRLIEGFVRRFGGIPSWDSMKLSAVEASAPGGGASYVAGKLQALVAAHGANLQLHALGHSAGAIFHAHFLRVANVPFRSLHLLAPAIRVDDYHRHLDRLLAPGPGATIQHARIYTMRDRQERDDNCVTVYRKSLLYLINRGLEVRRDEPILGMERYLTKDPVVAQRFGISPGPGTIGEVVFSPSARSTATAHGCFDDDVPTMNDIVRAIRGSEPAPSYNNAGGGKCTKTTAFNDDAEVPRELQMFFQTPQAPPLPGVPIAIHGVDTRGFGAWRGTGRRRALCVGINNYPTAPLNGCVADAELWARTLATLGFEAPALLVNTDATRQNILARLTELLESSTPGDVVVFQFAGHGTEVRDLNGDEEADKDQALCPYDFADGRLLIDDDVAELFTKIPAGVGLTCFLDNCHSGTATRFAVGRADTRAVSGDRPRFVVADAQLEEKHASFRRERQLSARSTASRGPDTMREVVFSACKPEELAWESNGQGDFTRNAIALLSAGAAITNEQFQEQLTTDFTPAGRQHPTLDCAPAAKGATLFGFGLGEAPASPQPPQQPPPEGLSPTGPIPAAPTGVSKWLRDVADVVDRRR